MQYEQLNQNILTHVGGKENIQAVAHCVTRLRLTLHDRMKANTEAIKQLDGVIDVVSNEVAYQIIIGTHVSDVYHEFMGLLGLQPDATNPANEQSQAKGLKGRMTSLLSVVSETMTSIVEVLIVAGILAGILSICTMTGLLAADSPTYQIFETLRTSIFHFLPVFIAASAAKRLNVSPYLAMVLAVTVLSTAIDGAADLALFGYQLPTIQYANTFIPIMLGVWFLGRAVTYLEKIIPKKLHFFLVPTLALMITLPVMLILFGPLGMWLGNGINAIFTLLRNTIGNWVVVALYAAFQPFMIVFGAANFVYPIVISLLATLGHDPIFNHAATISDVAVCGAMVGYFLRSRQGKEKQLFGTVSFSALMGVTEPAIFGVFVKYRRPFLAVIVGGGIGGTVAGLAGVKTMGIVWGLQALPTYFAGGVANFTWMLISVLLSFTIAAAVAYGIGVPVLEEEANTATDLTIDLAEGAKQLTIGQITEGAVIPLCEVNDQAFASGALGKGVGIVPTTETATVTAPFAGTITVVFPTKHAYGIRSAEGVELLIHIGIDTVHLNGSYFESFVVQGQQVQAGERLAQVDVANIKDSGFDPTVIAVVTNSNDYLDVISTTDAAATDLLTVIM